MSGQTLRFEHHRDREMVPRFLVRAVGILMLLSLMLVTYARVTDRPLEATPPASPIVRERLLFITGDMSGAATIRGEGGALIADLDPTEGGFISGVWRALARERTKYGVAPTEPVRLIGYADGRMALHDPLTDWRVQLIGFGKDNAAAFARLLADRPGPDRSHPVDPSTRKRSIPGG